MFIKGFDENLRCRGYQFEVGKVYDTGAKDDELRVCSASVFHFCKSLEDVHNFYSALPSENNRFCEVEVLGGFVEDEEKCGTNKIKIVREITGDELAMLRGYKNGNTGLFNTGGCNTGNWNTGNCNTSNRNTGDCNTGDWNTGNRNTGNRNTGDWNTGDCNTGNWNTGNCNTGNCNTSNRNTGDCNTGMFNACSRSNGFFNTKQNTVPIFNKDSGLTWDEILYTDWYDALFNGSFVLTEWIYYTDEEKENSPIRQAIGGYLKKYTYEEACENWWKSLSDRDKKLIQRIPNFDKDIFKEITGIEV